MRAETARRDQVPELAGRHAERSRLIASIEQLLAGERGVVVIRGRPGMGKTHLLRWMLPEAAARGVRSTLIRPPSSIPLPMMVLVQQILEGLHATALAPDATGSHESAVIALAEQLDRAVGDGCALVAVDDLRSVVPEARRVVLDAIRLAGGRIGLVCTWRTGDEPDGLPTGMESHGELPLATVDLDGMSLDEVSAIAGMRLGGDVLPSLATELHSQTLGVPLFMVELLRRWQAEGAIMMIGGCYVLDEDRAQVSTTLAETLAAAAADLKPEELLVARCLALVDRALTFEELCTATGLASSAITGALTGLGSYAWVVPEQTVVPPRFQLAHQLHGEAVLGRADAALVAGLHEALLALELGPDQRAHHAVRALTPPETLDQIVEHAAAEATIEGDAARAAAWWGVLADRRGGDPVGRSAALLEWARALSRADPKAAIDRYDEVIRLDADAAAVRAAAVGRAELASLLGDHDQGIATLRATIAETPDEQRDDLTLRLASLLISFGRSEEARADLEEMTARGVPTAFGLLAMFPYIEGDLNETCRLLEEGLDRSEPGTGQLFMLNNLAWARVLIGEWHAAERALAMAIPEAERGGIMVRLWRLQACAVSLDAWRGRLARALDVGSRAARTARTLAPFDVSGDIHNALAIALMTSGSPTEAIEVLTPYATVDVPLFSTTMVDAALACDRMQDAKHHLATAEVLAQDPIRAVTIARLRAEVALAEGDNAGAVALLEPWRSEPSSVVFEQARAMRTAAEALWRVRRRRDAIEAARAAHQAFDLLGAVPSAKETAGWLSGRGPIRRRREPGEVTEREREVLELAVQGLTNAQIAERLVLSPGTIKKHIENILARTGARRRSELHRYVRRLDD